MKDPYIYTVLNILILSGCAIKPEEQIILPLIEQERWANPEIGVIIHSDINIYAPETIRYEDKNTLPPLSVFNSLKSFSIEKNYDR